jgi:methionyl-tRNA formyltransferase
MNGSTDTGLVLLGSKEFGAACLERVLALVPDRILAVLSLDDRSDTRSHYDRFRQLCTGSDIPLHFVANRREADLLLLKIRPTAALVASWYWITPPHVLEAAQNGLYAIHNSLLPKYRGGAPLVWAIINGESEVGLSLFRLREEVDSGEVVAQRHIAVGPNDYVSDLLERLQKQAIEVLDIFIPAMLKGELPATPQESNKATYAAMRRPGDGLISWHWPAQQVYNFIRAQSHPYPGAYTSYREQRLIIWRASPVDMVYYGTPGQVAQVCSDGVLVVCGDNRPLLIQKVQQAGGETTAAHRLLKSTNIRLVSALHLKQSDSGN